VVAIDAEHFMPTSLPAAEPIAGQTDDKHSLVRDIALVASISSALDELGIQCSECKEHFYTLLSEWAKQVDAEYITDAAVIAADKKRDATTLVNIWGEEGFALVLGYVASNSCNIDLLREVVTEITEILGFSSDAAREFNALAAEADCRRLRSLIVLALMIPPRG